MKQIAYILILISSQLYSQSKIIVLDAYDNAPISYAKIISKEGLIKSTDSNGEIAIDSLKSHDTKFIVQNEFYKEQIFDIKDVNADLVLKLSPFENVLDEVKVSNVKKEYRVISGYYRKYKLVNGILVGFVDAEVEYYTAIDCLDENFESILNYRFLENSKKPIEDENSNYIVSTLGDINGVDYLKCKTLYDKVQTKCTFIPNTAFKRIDLFDEKKIPCGEIVTEKSTKIFFNSESEKINKIVNLLGYRYQLLEVLAMEEYASVEMNNLKIDDLKYKKSLIKFNFKHKKETTFNEILIENEFFPQTVFYLTKEEYKEHRKNKLKFDRNATNYSSHFWENLSNIYPLNSTINTQLNPDLKEVKK